MASPYCFCVKASAMGDFAVAVGTEGIESVENVGKGNGGIVDLLSESVGSDCRRRQFALQGIVHTRYILK